MQIMQEQSTLSQVVDAGSVKLLNRCTTKRARAETRKRVRAKQKEQVKKKKSVNRVPYTRNHLQNAVDALVEAHYNKRREKTVLSVRKAAALFMDNKFSTLNRFMNKYKVITKIKEMKK